MSLKQWSSAGGHLVRGRRETSATEVLLSSIHYPWPEQLNGPPCFFSSLLILVTVHRSFENKQWIPGRRQFTGWDADHLLLGTSRWLDMLLFILLRFFLLLPYKCFVRNVWWSHNLLWHEYVSNNHNRGNTFDVLRELLLIPDRLLQHMVWTFIPVFQSSCC